MGLADVITAPMVQTAPGETMSLPAAMNALQRGEIAPPADLPGALGGLMHPSSALPSLPTPKPRPDPIGEIVREQRAADERDREDMLIRARARRLQQQL